MRSVAAVIPDELVQARLDALEAKHGSLVEAARALRVDYVTLYRYRVGNVKPSWKGICILGLTPPFRRPGPGPFSEEDIRRLLISRLRDYEGVITSMAIDVGITPIRLGEMISGWRKPGTSVLKFLGLKMKKVVTVTYVRDTPEEASS